MVKQENSIKLPAAVIRRVNRARRENRNPSDLAAEALQRYFLVRSDAAEKHSRAGITSPSMSSEEKKAWFVVTAPARRRLKRIPARDLSRISAAIEEMKDDPLQGDVRKLHGGLEGFRRRVGD
jgi:hypothetical protein